VKRAAALLLAALLTLSLGGCGELLRPEPTAAAVSPVPTVPPATAEPAPTAVSTPEPAAAPTPVITAAPTVEPEPEEVLEVTAGGVTRSYAAKRTKLELHPGVFCTVLVPVREMSAVYTENAWQLRGNDQPEDGFLELSYIAGTTAEELLPGLMDGYLEFTDIEFSDVASIGQLSGTFGHVSATDGSIQADGWVVDTDGGVIALVRVCSREQETREPGNLLSAVLDSFELTD